MSEDFTPSFLGGEPVDAAPAADTPAATPEVVAADAAPAADAAASPEPDASTAEGPKRGPDGKFAAADAPDSTPPASPAAETPPTAPPPPDPMAPVAALVDERLKRQRAEDERDAANLRATQLQQWRDQQEALARAQPVKSREEDPAGWEQRREAQFQAALNDQRLMTSRAVAEVKHGEDVVSKAYQWGFDRCATDPYFNAKVAASTDPVGTVVAEWKREQLLSRIDPAQLDAFQQWQAQQAAAPAPGSPQVQPIPAAQPAAPAAPRASLAAGPSAGRADTARVGDGGEVFDGMFQR
jgi:chemotaxis protein histidine kinase CheA